MWNVAFDLSSERFFHIDHAGELPVYQIPLRRLKDPAEYFRKLSGLDNEQHRTTADLLFNRFKDYQLPVVTLGDMSINDVAPVFERINSTGTRLTIYDLMRAATWSQEFDLSKTIDDIKGSLESKRFDTFDNKTFLRALGAASGRDFSSGSIDALRGLPSETLLEAAGELKAAAQLAADFLATEIGAPRAEALPYANQFAVLCELFRVLPNPNAAQLTEIKHWFWLTTLSGYFGGWNSGQMTIDAGNIRSFAQGESSSLKVSAAIPDPSLWLTKPFRSTSAVSKMLGVMFGHRAALDLFTGQKIDADKSLAWSNDKEYHHFFPQRYLARVGISSVSANVVGNIVLMTSRSNISIRDAAPSNYLQRIIANDGRDALVKRLESNLIPESALDAALADDYSTFLEVRGSHLHRIAMGLAGRTVENPEEVSAEEIDDSDDDPTE